MLSLSTHNQDIETAKTLLNKGEIIALPTDTVYGIVSTSSNTTAQNEIYKIKNREKNKKLILFCSNIEMIKNQGAVITETSEKLIKEFWPGALTLILKANNDAIGFRIPKHSALLKLIDSIGEPLASTSANMSNQPTLETANDILKTFDGKIAAVISDDSAVTGKPSTIVDCTTETPRILREGAIPSDKIFQEI